MTVLGRISLEKFDKATYDSATSGDLVAFAEEVGVSRRTVVTALINALKVEAERLELDEDLALSHAIRIIEDFCEFRDDDSSNRRDAFRRLCLHAADICYNKSGFDPFDPATAPGPSDKQELFLAVHDIASAVGRNQLVVMWVMADSDCYLAGTDEIRRALTFETLDAARSLFVKSNLGFA